MAGGVNFSGTKVTKKKKPMQGPEMPVMEKIRQAAKPMRGNYSLEDTRASYGLKPRTTFPKTDPTPKKSNPDIGYGNFDGSTPKTGGSHPPGGLKRTPPATPTMDGGNHGTQVRTNKASATKPAFTGNAGDSVKQRGATVSYQQKQEMQRLKGGPVGRKNGEVNSGYFGGSSLSKKDAYAAVVSKKSSYRK